MPLIPEIGRQRQVDVCEFKASLANIIIFRVARAARGNLVSTNKQQRKTKRELGLAWMSVQRCPPSAGLKRLPYLYIKGGIRIPVSLEEKLRAQNCF